MKYFGYLLLFVFSKCTHEYLAEREVTINKATQKLIVEYQASHQFEAIKLVRVEDTRDSSEILIVNVEIGDKLREKNKGLLTLTKNIAEQFHASLLKREIQNVHKVEVWLTKQMHDRKLFNRSRSELFPFWIQDDVSFKTNRLVSEKAHL